LIILICPQGIFKALGQVHDMQLWTSAEVRKEFFNRLKISPSLQSRFNNNMSNLSSLMTDFGAEYKVTDYYASGLVYRMSDIGERPLSQRICFDNSFTYKRFNDRFELRLRLQRRFANITSSELDRMRLRVGYTHIFSKKFRTYIKAEYFYAASIYRRNWDRQRYSAGVITRIYKVHFLELFYRYQAEFNRENPEREYIFGVGYILDL
jgi:hypothetical protein